MNKINLDKFNKIELMAKLIDISLNSHIRINDKKASEILRSNFIFNEDQYVFLVIQLKHYLNGFKNTHFNKLVK